MFSLRIIDTARFLKMPVDTRELYFQLGLHADDDGIVEAYPILKQVGASEDNLKILVAKGFVQVLNEDLITYVNDWQEHNTIRADRKIDSIYKNLLLQIKDESEIVQPRPRADKKKLNGQPMDNQWTTNGRHRLGKDRLGKDRLGKDRLGKDRLGKDIITSHLSNDELDLLNIWNDCEHLRTHNLETINLYFKKKHSDIIQAITPDKVKDAIFNYNVFCAAPDKFYWAIKWTFPEFIARGLQKFVNEAEPLTTFLKHKPKQEEPEETMAERLARIDQGDIRYE